MAGSEKRIVWILGAGFSKALGAPLLSELFSSAQFDRVREPYSKASGDHTAFAITHLYAAGVHGILGANPVQRQWEHAEEFLERLDIALASAAERKRLARFCRVASAARGVPGFVSDGLDNLRPRLESQGTIADVNLAALKLLVAECSIFLEGVDTQYERWKPYKRWAKHFRRLSRPQGDTVVTFNYDLVLENLDDLLEVMLPKETNAELLKQHRSDGLVPVLKLHGSVDWIRNDQGEIERSEDPLAALQAKSGDEIVLATPGPKKQRMISEDRGLGMLWDAAEEAIRDADIVVLIGYRIPPTDAYTRNKLLSLVHQRAVQVASDNITGPQNFHFVLGPDVESVDAKRLKGLIESAGSIAKQRLVGTWPQPMFAEDFLDVFNRDEL